LGWDYPIHLGVTEAGEGEDGRVKSAIGIGSLLLDGIGDTIRVSLTEDPWFEIDPCKRLVGVPKYGHREIPEESNEILVREKIAISEKTALHRDGSVIIPVTNVDIEKDNFYDSIGVKVQLGRPARSQNSCDALLLQEAPSAKAEEKLSLLEKGGIKVFRSPFIIDEHEDGWKKLLDQKPDVIFFAPEKESAHTARRFFTYLKKENITTPVILSFNYTCSPEDLTIYAAAENGLLLCDGLGEGIALRGQYPLSTKLSLSFAILQGCRKRNFKTEFISCPGCGRTLFNLQNVAAKIREKTAHLPGVKIAIMGCIVNGPGEMADADFGYVGSKPGKIDLYVGKECVQRDLDMEGAEEHLIDLIKAHGKWIEPSLEKTEIVSSVLV
jgi:(E)-4-hydroxy-3-methylbut-2-enyl-diphosphate synthase